MVSGIHRLAPVWALACCYPAGVSVQFVAFVLFVAVPVLVIVLVDRWRRPGSTDRTWRRLLPSSAAGWRSLGAAGAVVCWVWLLPALDALRSGGGNVRQLVRLGRTVSGESQGAVRGLLDVAHALVWDPATTRSAQVGPTTLVVVGATAFALVASLAVGRTWARSTRADRRLVLVAVIALGASVLGVATLPADEGFGFIRIVATSVASAFAWFAAGTLLARVRRPTARALPPTFAVGAATVALLAIAAAVPLPITPTGDYMPWTMDAVPSLADQVASELPSAGRWQVHDVGPRSVKAVVLGLDAALEGAGFLTDQRRAEGLVADDPTPVVGQLAVQPSFWPSPGTGWTPIAQYAPEEYDEGRAGRAASEIAAFARSVGAEPTPAMQRALPMLLCPGRGEIESGCDPAAQILAEPRPIDAMPDWLVAVAYVETFDEQLPFHALVTDAPPDDLLDRVRDEWTEIPISIYRRTAT